jgi:hypothetical protein
MEDPKALALFNEILATTREGRIPWEPAVSDTLLAAIKGKRSLVLRPYTDRDSYGNDWGAPSLVVRDSSDRELLRVTSEIEGVKSEALQDLYETARRQALRVDEQVQDLLSDLKSL